MLTLKSKNERGETKLDWLDSKHTFSFGNYYDPENRGFRELRVINEDVISPGGGFLPHSHANMEIFTYVLDGELEHKDSLGNGSTIRVGDIQIMSAGRGITHSEFNHSKTKPVHLLQIWIKPNKQDLSPTYQQHSFSDQERNGKLLLVLSNDERNGSLKINQDAKVYVSALKKNQTVTFENQQNRHAWIQVTRGTLTLNGKNIEAGDGLAISEEYKLIFKTDETAEFLLFDLP